MTVQANVADMVATIRSIAAQRDSWLEVLGIRRVIHQGDDRLDGTAETWCPSDDRLHSVLTESWFERFYGSKYYLTQLPGSTYVVRAGLVCGGRAARGVVVVSWVAE